MEISRDELRPGKLWTGGLFADPEKDTLYVYMVPGMPADMAELQMAIRDILGPERLAEHPVEVLEAQHTFLQLRDWYSQMQPRVLPMPGVVVTGIDHAKNRLRVGVETSAVASAVETELVRLAIPREAVNIERARLELSVEKVPVTDVSQRGYSGEPFQECFGGLVGVQCLNRPLVGGIQIENNVATGDCTYSFNATKNVALGHVTASHCANTPFKNTGTIFTQPISRPPFNYFRISTETLNPPTLPDITCDEHKCPKNSTCRCSDTLFAQLDLGGFFGKTGFIARGLLDSVTWNGKDYFTITSTALGSKDLMVGDPVTKVGRSTGRTQGTIQQVCQDEKQQTKDGDVFILCQYEASCRAVGGDSGAPVFKCLDKDQQQLPCNNPDATFNVKLSGVTWAKTAADGDVFSPLWLIQLPTELGGGPKLVVCAPGFGC